MSTWLCGGWWWECRSDWSGSFSHRMRAYCCDVPGQRCWFLLSEGMQGSWGSLSSTVGRGCQLSRQIREGPFSFTQPWSWSLLTPYTGGQSRGPAWWVSCRENPEQQLKQRCRMAGWVLCDQQELQPEELVGD